MTCCSCGLWTGCPQEGVEATLGLLWQFREHGAMVWSLREPWTETFDPRMAELLGSLFAWMTAEESRRRSERVRAGLDRRRREGLPVGSPGRRTASRADAAATLPGGNGNGHHDRAWTVSVSPRSPSPSCSPS
jgi:hypothetical protein